MAKINTFHFKCKCGEKYQEESTDKSMEAECPKCGEWNHSKINHSHGYAVGDKIKFKAYKQSFKVSACNDRFIICWKPYNLKKTYMYTIVDLKAKIRGKDNWMDPRYDYSDIKEAAEALKNLKSDEDSLYCVGQKKISISGRNRVKLDIQ